MKRITHNTNNTVVELFSLRNGDKLPHTTGNENYDTGTSQSFGTPIVYNPDINNTYSDENFRAEDPILPDMKIGDGNFVFNQTRKHNNTNYVADG